jgi:hypothetical protein
MQGLFMWWNMNKFIVLALLALSIYVHFCPPCAKDTADHMFAGRGSHSQCLYLVDGEIVDTLP